MTRISFVLYFGGDSYLQTLYVIWRQVQKFYKIYTLDVRIIGIQKEIFIRGILTL
jgi:hypothetical protein